jgi:uncharacterized protein
MDRTDASSSTSLPPAGAPSRRVAPVPGVQVRETPGRGQGVFATRFFPTGALVMTGFIETELDRNDPHASQIGERRFVRHGGMMPKVNHSCDPCCGVRLNASGAHDLVSRAPIAMGQEITFDYAMRNYTIEHFPEHCRCGAPSCRDRITGWKDLASARKAAYRDVAAPYLLELDRRQAGPARPASSGGE